MEIPISYALVQIKEILAPILSNALRYGIVKESVCFPYEFTLLSNKQGVSVTNEMFVFPTNLHCSQTQEKKSKTWEKFVFPTNLHCSQTTYKRNYYKSSLFSLRIYTALKPRTALFMFAIVCFPYEFTLLSNMILYTYTLLMVCFPYEFTLLSNQDSVYWR